jgi:hypothetical protein
LNSKQINLNLVFIFHNLASIPCDLVRIADTLTIFRTGDGKLSLDKYPHPEIPKIQNHLVKSKNRFENHTIRLN